MPPRHCPPCPLMMLRTFTCLSLLPFLGCQWARRSGETPAGPDEAYPVSLSVVAAEASLHRLADPDAEDDLLQDMFVLQVECDLEVSNRSGKEQEVLSQFGSPFDDLRLRIRDKDGNRLVSTSHTLLMDPLLEPQWTRLSEGVTTVRLVSAAPVLPWPPEDESPFILASRLTKVVQVEFFGGFPGSEISRALQSNRVTVEIDDRTLVVPRKTLPVPAARGETPSV